MGAREEIEIRLLGPFEVSRDGRPVDVPQGRLRVILATLALAPGQVVGVDALSQRLWGEALPARPKDGVQNHVRRLRRILSPQAIRTAVSGYWLDVSAEQVDVSRFLSLVDRASRAHASGDVSEARSQLRAASKLWRGEPLEGVESDALRTDAAPSLTERYLAAEEQRIDLDRAEGRQHSHVVAELCGLIARHPLRESLWVRLLTALHDAGRQAEALEHYHSVRRRLADQLGVDPSHELRRAYQMLLAADADGAAQAPAAAPESSADAGAAKGDHVAGSADVIPRQLPPDVPGFVGRGADLAVLDAALKEFLDDSEASVTPHSSHARTTAAIFVVHGVGGVGKTALAVRWAHSAADRFPQGQLYLDLHGYGPQESMSPQAALAAVLRSLGVHERVLPSGVQERAALLRSRLAGRRVLMVLDNAGAAEQVRPLLPASKSLVVVTSRSQLRGLSARDGARSLPLSELDEPEARRLLAATIGAARVAEEPDAVQRLIHLCGGLPLALRIAAELASRHPGMSLTALADELRARRLEILANPDDPVTDLRAVFSWSYESLKPGDAFVFRKLGLYPGSDISLPAAAALIDTSGADARRTLDRLVAVHLLEQRHLGRYRFHDLLREYAAERTSEEDTEEERHTAVRRVLDWYLRTATAASAVVAPGRQMWSESPEPAAGAETNFHDQVRALDWYDTEREVLVAAVRQAAAIGADDIAWRLASSLSAYFVLRPVWEEWESVHETALSAATRAGDQIGRGAILTGLGTLRVGIGRDDDALGHYQQALKLFREAGARAQEATVLVLMGNAHQFLGRPQQALTIHHQSLALAREIGDPAREAHVLTNLAITQSSLGRHEDAAESSRRALEIRHTLGDHRGRAPALDNLGDAYVGLGEHAKAAACYREAIEIAGAHRDLRSEGIFLANLAKAEHGAGQPEEARATAARAWKALAEFSDAEAALTRDRLREWCPAIGQAAAPAARQQS